MSDRILGRHHLRLRVGARLLVVTIAAFLALTPAAEAEIERPDEAALSSAIEALSIQNEGISVSARPVAERSPAQALPFERRQGNEVGLDAMNLLTPKEYFPPHWNGRGVAAGDVDGDGFKDVVLATREGPRLYGNEAGMIFVERPLGLPEPESLDTFAVALVDIDDDGLLDLFFTTYRTGNYYILNRGGALDAGKLERPPASPTVLTKALTFGDVDEDGDLDVVLGNWYYGYAKQIPPVDSQNKLLIRDDGGFTVRGFDEITGETLSVLLSDFDGDGHLDLIVGNDFTPPDIYYRGNGAGGFSMIKRAEGVIPVSTDTTMSVDTGDFNNDLEPDIYMAQIAGRATGPSTRIKTQVFVEYCEVLNREEDRKRCRESVISREYFSWGAQHRPINIVRCKTLVDDVLKRECAAMMTILTVVQTRKEDFCERIPKDQTHSRFICDNYFAEPDKGTPAQYAESIKKYMNENVFLVGDSSGHFSNRAKHLGVETTGWSWNARFLDLDNDGWQDLYVVNGSWQNDGGTPQKFFLRNERGVRFSERTDDYGLQNFMLQSAYVAFDVENDGDLDLVTNSINGPTWFYRNGDRENASVLFELRDAKGNSHCVGCRVTLHTSDGKAQTREIKSGGGFLSFDAPFVHFGLGALKQVDRVSIHWSTGETSEISGALPANAIYTIERN